MSWINKLFKKSKTLPEPIDDGTVHLTQQYIPSGFTLQLQQQYGAQQQHAAQQLNMQYGAQQQYAAQQLNLMGNLIYPTASIEDQISSIHNLFSKDTGWIFIDYKTSKVLVFVDEESYNKHVFNTKFNEDFEAKLLED